MHQIVKSDCKDLTILQTTFMYKINAVHLNFLFIKNKKLFIAFNNDNKKCFLSTKSANNSAFLLQEGIHYIFYIYIKMEKSCLKMKCFFKSNKCSLAD